jgi:hypothetical protein
MGYFATTHRYARRYHHIRSYAAYIVFYNNLIKKQAVSRKSQRITRHSTTWHSTRVQSRAPHKGYSAPILKTFDRHSRFSLF